MSEIRVQQANGSSGDPDSGKSGNKEAVPGDGEDERTPAPSGLVWAVRLASLAILFGIIGYLLYLALRPQVAAQFDIALQFDEAERRQGSWVLPVELTNTSTEAVGSVMLEVAQGDATRTATVSLLGEGETAVLEFHLPREPREGAVEASVLSYQSP